MAARPKESPAHLCAAAEFGSENEPVSAATARARPAASAVKREVIQGGGPFHTAVKTGTELAAEAEQSLVVIDAEIARVT